MRSLEKDLLDDLVDVLTPSLKDARDREVLLRSVFATAAPKLWQDFDLTGGAGLRHAGAGGRQ